MAALTAKPCRVSASHTIRINAASPPNRWAQPVMSRKQAMRGIERHQRREAVAPVGDGVQRVDVGGFIGIEYIQLRADGAGIGERQTDFKP